VARRDGVDKLSKYFHLPSPAGEVLLKRRMTKSPLAGAFCDTYVDYD